MLPTIIPPVSMIVLILAIAMPWGIPEDLRAAPPFLPLAAIYFWFRADGAPVPAWLVLASGLTVDVLSGGPLGYWPLVYFFGLAATAISPSAATPVDHASEWLRFAPIIMSTAVFAWTVAAVYSGAPSDPWPTATAAIAVFAIWPVVAALFGPLERLVANRRPHTG